MSTKELRDFFHPKSIAIIGASTDFTTISGKPMKNLIHSNFGGEIYPVNPRYDSIEGYKCFDSILDIPGKVDLALIAVSASRLISIMGECISKNVKNILLFSSGFAEIGDSGKKIQDEVAKMAQENDIRIIGPNSVGCLNVKDSIPMGFATSMEAEKGFIRGNIGLVSQSGALGFSVFGLAQEESLGFTYVINTGNEMDITTVDSIEFMLEDDETTVIAAYMEGIPNGEHLITVAKRAKVLRKPLIILKAGKSAIGKEAASSHTASLAGSEEMFQVIAKQYGIITVKDIDEMIDVMKIVSRRKWSNGRKVVTISNSGAAGIAMADFSEEFGLILEPLQGETKDKIDATIPSYGSALNPIDITAQALKEQHILTETVETLVRDDNTDIIVIQTTFGGVLGEQICRSVVEIDKREEKPIIVTVTGTEELTGKGRQVLRESGVPVYKTTYDTMLAVKHLVELSEFYHKETDLSSPVSRAHQPDNVQYKTRVWTEDESKRLLKQLDIRVPENAVIQSVEQIESYVEGLKFPLVAKIISKDILHKTDAGGVKLGVQNIDEAKQAYIDIMEAAKNYNPNAHIQGVLLEEMLNKNGIEMFIGVKSDPQFGSFLVCGLGGIFIEVLKDISIRHIPITKEEAKTMVEELKGYPLLLGTRGQERSDIEAFADALVKISDYVDQQNGTLKEMDINPVVVLNDGEGIIALDGLFVWDEVESAYLVSNQ
ncbi:acetate--CoA ligase family protein [Psychrobacillus lasiicapitis]|uniref:Acetate--CoA ligase family protein n=1 Tax=Psychrobacillus lasiicapitis TaxID=1636719 RepID=A0A544T2Z8_9BACI|nr:acetate--CoA ligase family protein [Psychrobacillus lasiicapitis]TQR11832.1 acetate--CoA ligase family protein [Psychrobacillus lasiicapitis]GGA19833.1 CoA-binding protein [Psychrobacillus lasiicapitis]